MTERRYVAVVGPGEADDRCLELAEAVGALDRLEMQLHAAAARRRLGRLVGGEEGSALMARGAAAMAAQLVRSPDRMTALLVPGFRD